MKGDGQFVKAGSDAPGLLLRGLAHLPGRYRDREVNAVSVSDQMVFDRIVAALQIKLDEKAACRS